MINNTPGNKEPNQMTSDAVYDALEQDLAENIANNKRGCCTRFAQYFCSFFSKSNPTIKASAELKNVVVNPTFSLNDPDSDGTSLRM
jgi:hypothetical protein